MVIGVEVREIFAAACSVFSALIADLELGEVLVVHDFVSVVVVSLLSVREMGEEILVVDWSISLWDLQFQELTEVDVTHSRASESVQSRDFVELKLKL